MNIWWCPGWPIHEHRFRLTAWWCERRSKRRETVATRETLKEFVERRRRAHLSYEETERELYEILGERDGLLVAAGVNGLAFTKLFQKIAQIEAANEQAARLIEKWMDLHKKAEEENERLRAQGIDLMLPLRVSIAEKCAEQAKACIEAALAKLLIHREYATPDQLREAMREAVKTLRGELVDPTREDDVWRCVCGIWNLVSEGACSKCTSTRSFDASIMPFSEALREEKP